jgi:hypothetical protein
MSRRYSPTAVTTMIPTEICRRSLDDRQVNSWQTELNQSVLNGPRAEGMQVVRVSNPRTST